MTRNFRIIIFFIVLFTHLAGIQFSNAIIQSISKPLLIPVLTIHFLVSVNFKSDFKKWIFLALLFSWAGDVLLMFVPQNETFFLAGLGSFLLAHIFYIIFFHRVRMNERIKPNPWLLVIVVIYYAALMTWLSPYLGDMKLPVRIYGVVISFMFMLALHMLYIKDRMAGKWMMPGALLFVSSDSILAINKFYQPFEWAGIAIMLTYGMAQLFIVEGAIRYMNAVNKE